MDHKNRKPWLSPLLVGLSVAIAGAVFMQIGALESWSDRISDRLFASRASDSRIVIVTIDDASMARLGRWPWPRSTHAKIIDTISQAKPLAIGYDVSFPEASDEDEELARALRDSGKAVMPVELTPEKTGSGEYYEKLKVLPPVPLLALSAAGVGYANLDQDVDGVVRRASYSRTLEDGTLLTAFAVKVAQIAGVNVSPTEFTDEKGRFLINYPGQPRKGFRMFSASDLVDGKVSAQELSGKIVLVGSTAPNLHDDNLVPTSFNVPMPGVEIHASIIDTILQKKWLREVPSALAVLCLLFLGALVGLLVPKLKARWSVPFVFVAWASFLVLAIILFEYGFVADVLWPSFVLIFAFAAVVLERRIKAEQQKREIRSAFSRYVSESVVSSILADTSKLKLGGDRRRMTVLFSDVRGFTTISEGLKPEKLVEVMNAYLSRMTDEVFKHEGVLDKYIGDAVMAFWNAPFDQADHGRRAVDTALDMLAALKDMNANGAFGGLELKIGVGVNTGDMVVGNMGSEKRFDYTVIGDSVNLGSRLESLTKEYGVCLLITETTKQEIGNGYLTRTVDLVAVKGKKEPVRIYELVKRSKNATQDDKQFFKKYEDAIAAYFGKDFTAAERITRELLDERPDDGPSKTLNSRASTFIKEPPPADWNGVWVMTKK